MAIWHRLQRRWRLELHLHGLAAHGEVIDAASGIYSELKNVCVWNKNNGGMGSLYRSKHEFVFVYKAGTAPHLNMSSSASTVVIEPTSGTMQA